MMNSKRIIASIVAVVIAVIGVVSVSNQAQAAYRPSLAKSVVIYSNNGQRPPQTNRVKVTPFRDFWKVLRYTR